MIFIPGIAGAVIFVVLLVLLIWMICVRATRSRRVPEKTGLGPGPEVNKTLPFSGCEVMGV